jgi:hypothetical protein
MFTLIMFAIPLAVLVGISVLAWKEGIKGERSLLVWFKD